MRVEKLMLGAPEAITPFRYKQPALLEAVAAQDIAGRPFSFSASPRGCRLTYELEPGEEIFGFGLQLKGFRHRGTKKQLRNKSDPVANTGDTHAPVPFFVTNRGYGLYVDTARYATFYCGVGQRGGGIGARGAELNDNTASLYRTSAQPNTMLIEVPVAQGMDVYVFSGGSIDEIVAAYNLFSGGGCMPPLWGLGTFYRCYLKYDSRRVREMASYFRREGLPLTILGLEPGWQDHSYSCSYVWDRERYPDHRELMRELREQGFHVSLWEHAFVNAAAPIHEDIAPHSGDYEVWGGLVPDFATPQGRRIFADYHHRALIAEGVDGFKLDECDGSDFTGGWSFPNCAAFPSGMDGEQMHCLLGTLYQQTLMEALGDRRTLSEARSAGAFAAPYPFVLYSDLYDHGDFIRGLVNAGFSGLLWTPEVRDAKNRNDLLRRIQSVVFSPQALVNGWYIEEAPWLSLGCEQEVRELFRLRMALIPYLYTAFYDYHTQGKPPVRALVSAFDQDAETYAIDDAYLFGDDMLVAPILGDATGRRVYLPGETVWYDFWTQQPCEPGWREVDTPRIPVYVRQGALLPLAQPVESIDGDTLFEVTLRAYGAGGKARLVVDDGLTHSTAYRVLEVGEDGFLPENARYRIAGVERI